MSPLASPSGRYYSITMDVSKLTAKYQVTIPADVRKALGLAAGDRVAFTVDEEGRAVLRKVTEADWEWARFVGSQLSEWNNEANEKAWSYL